MKDWAIILIVCMGILIIFGGTTLLIINEIRERIGVCENIGEKLNLEFYDFGFCNCFTDDCDYCCKFINENGSIVIKNIK